MLCSDCNKPIKYTDKTAEGPDGLVHYTCFKRMQGQGKEIDLDDEISKLKRRVQNLERELGHISRSVDFKVG